MERVEVIPAATRAEKVEFVALPYRLYAGDRHWVAPLRVEERWFFVRGRHPFLHHAEMCCFLARSSGVTVGRIAAIVDREYNRFHNCRTGFFGFFEAVESRDVAQALFGAARAWLAGRGFNRMLGPMNPSVNYECGLLVEGFSADPFVLMPYNPPYYEKLYECAGLVKAKNLLAFKLTRSTVRVDRLRRIGERALRAQRARIRPADFSDLAGEATRVWSAYNESWKQNWGYAPLARDEALFHLRRLRPVLRPELALFIEADGRTVGFGLAIPDANVALKPLRGRLFPLGYWRFRRNLRRVRAVRLLVVGIEEAYRGSGLLAALAAALLDGGFGMGIETCEISWLLEDNVPAIRAARAAGATHYKTYRVYQAEL